jgi:hypothetical protein
MNEFFDIMSIDKWLSTEETAQAVSFLSRLSIEEQTRVDEIIKVVNEVAIGYFNSSEPRENDYAFFRRERDGDERHVVNGYPFFAVYGTGGILTKGGQRPDIDLLVATNYRNREGYMEPFSPKEETSWHRDGERFYLALHDALSSENIVEIVSPLPENYKLTETKGKRTHKGYSSKSTWIFKKTKTHTRE